MPRSNDPWYVPTKDFRLPEASAARLTEMKRRKLATSDLSTDEVLLTRAAGFKPLGFVMGVSVFHVPSYSFSNSNYGNCEFSDLSQALYSMRESAMVRMEAEADVLGADGVVGVHFGYHATTHGSEFHAYGTAVKADEQKHPNMTWRNNRGMPFLSDLSGQAFYKCVAAGYAPLGFVLGVCVFHVGYRSWNTVWKQRNSIVEIPLYTQAMYDARELAMERMQAEAEELDADLVLEFELTQHAYEGWGHTTEFLSSGTAVRQFKDDPEIDLPTLVLTLGH